MAKKRKTTYRTKGKKRKTKGKKRRSGLLHRRGAKSALAQVLKAAASKKYPRMKTKGLKRKMKKKQIGLVVAKSIGGSDCHVRLEFGTQAALISGLKDVLEQKPELVEAFMPYAKTTARKTK